MKKLYILALIILSKVFALTQPVLIGSTFDYPPLTFIESGKYAGLDIKIISQFAQDNNLSIKFIQTTWPNLSNDLSDKKFTIAVGGVSDSKARRVFLMSDPVNTTWKEALVRCEDLAKFNSSKKINLPTTKIVENIGGTNQQFAKEYFSNAPQIVVNNNQLPFGYLLNKQADVMFTDNVEVNYIHQKNPKLCGVQIAGNYPISHKVFLFGKTADGYELLKMFNNWWQLHKQNFKIQ